MPVEFYANELASYSSA